MSHQNTFKRKELKFVLDEEKYARLMERLDGLMLEDEYGNEIVSNIYFDNDSDEMIRTSLSKPIYKEKLRLRCYGVPNDDTIAFAEIKKKYKGIVYKRRERMTYAEAFDWLVKGNPPAHPTQITDEIDFIIKKYGLRPKIIICYDRLAYYAKDDEEFRITFDSNIRSRTDELDLRLGCYGETLENQPYRIMELKTAEAIPLWMTEILSDLQIYIGSFSKYGSIYEQSIRCGINGTASENTRGNERKKTCFQVS
ncbi:MAG: polyphosphate polymerase domain-containing protein [Eubacterium sp.]|nr:polyphosphate polymerase domain-containing protein [Eubacterium sp.]